MELLLALIPILPMCGFLALALFGHKLSRSLIALIGTSSVGIPAIFTIVLGYLFLTSVPEGGATVVKLWEWLNTGGLSVDVAFRLDALSLIFIFVITFVGFLIHLYSVEFMRAMRASSPT
jgi:NADH-quinone oxidoreductase subunit L